MASTRMSGPKPSRCDKPLLAVLNGERRDPPPIWLMRQAGRYLPEYRQLRAEKGGFLDLVYDPDAAAEITLQPIRRFRLRRRDPLFRHPDRPVRARPGPELRGRRRAAPVAAAGRCRARRAGAVAGAAGADLRDCAESEGGACPPKRLCSALPAAPWTVATYMVAGQGSRDQAEARRLAYRDPGLFSAIIDAIEDVTRRLSVRPDRGRASKRCNCSTAGRAASPRRSSSAG